MIRIILLCLLTFTIAACFKAKPKELKSPCVSIESMNQDVASPCIRRKPINNDIA